MSRPPTVFISYSHDSDDQMDRVKALADRLRKDGIDCNIDQYESSPPEGWYRWMFNQIEGADFVLVAATKPYYHRFQEQQRDKSTGVVWEGAIVAQKLYDNPRSAKFIPIIFTASDISYIPAFLKGTTHYQLPSSYENLYRQLTNNQLLAAPLGLKQRISGSDNQLTATGGVGSVVQEISGSIELLITNAFRIDRLEIKNFKKLAEYTLDLCPKITLLVGDNGAGKTTILDALAIAAGVWLIDYPDATLANSGRNILSHEIRAETIETADSFRLTDCKPVEVSATGVIGTETVSWKRKISLKGTRTSNADSKKARQIVARLFEQDRMGEKSWLPIIAYYGAGRAWLPSNSRDRKTKLADEPSRRWDAFYDCLAERIRIGDLQNWFHREAIAALNRHGEMRMAYKVVKFAILHCIPEASNLWFDPDRLEIMLLIDGQALPFNSLSAGQKMMVALIADIAIKMVTQNFALLAEESDLDYQTLPQVLQKTPGLVLIDELDVHLHPKWQRRVVNDLKTTFPAIQFVCTSHSPFIIQSISQGELRSLDVEDSQPLQYANQSIEDIAEDIQLVEMPQQSLKAQQLAQATERYFALLQNQDAADSDELVTAEADYRQALEPFSDDPGLTAFLKLEAMAKAKEKEAE
jgi:predicted ATP-binding protein involved in virulence